MPSMDPFKLLGISRQEPTRDRVYPFYGYAPGDYFFKCSQCDTQAVGDKRSISCEPCAEARDRTIRSQYRAISADGTIFMLREEPGVVERFVRAINERARASAGGVTIRDANDIHHRTITVKEPLRIVEPDYPEEPNR